MNIRVLCPNGHPLAIDAQHAGMMVRCPLCQSVFVAQPPPVATLVVEPPPSPLAPSPLAPTPTVPPPVAPPPILPTPVIPAPPSPPLMEVPELPLVDIPELPELPILEAEEKEPARSARERSGEKKQKVTTGERLQRVGLGLGFLYCKLLCLVVAEVLHLVVAAVAQSEARSGMGRSIPVGLSCVLLVFVGLATLLGITGSILCFWVPQKTKARPAIILSFTLEVAGLVLSLAGTFLILRKSSDSNVVVILATLMSFGSWLFFLAFLRILAQYLNDPATAGEALRLFGFAIVLAVAVPFAILLLGSLFSRAPAMAISVLVGGAFFLITAWFKFAFDLLNVIGTLRQQIASRW